MLPVRAIPARPYPCRSGGIGRRAWFRSMYSQGCGGSSPFFGTKLSGKYNNINNFNEFQAEESLKIQPTSLIGGQNCVLTLFIALLRRQNKCQVCSSVGGCNLNPTVSGREPNIEQQLKPKLLNKETRTAFLVAGKRPHKLDPEIGLISVREDRLPTSDPEVLGHDLVRQLRICGAPTWSRAFAVHARSLQGVE